MSEYAAGVDGAFLELSRPGLDVVLGSGLIVGLVKRGALQTVGVQELDARSASSSFSRAAIRRRASRSWSAVDGGERMVWTEGVGDERRAG